MVTKYTLHTIQCSIITLYTAYYNLVTFAQQKIEKGENFKKGSIPSPTSAMYFSDYEGQQLFETFLSRKSMESVRYAKREGEKVTEKVKTQKEKILQQSVASSSVLKSVALRGEFFKAAGGDAAIHEIRGIHPHDIVIIIFVLVLDGVHEIIIIIIMSYLMI